MNSSLGRVIARLAEPTEKLSSEIVNLINERIKPPSAISADEVHVRAMYIASDRVNSFGGRFPVDEHARLAELLVDAPVLVGHRKDKLPVGRNFHAVITERDGCPWVKSYFYWLRSAEGADQLRDNIDGGIYKECSVAFTFGRPQCSICGKDIRRCEHEPFETYEQGGISQECHFEYREIERVLETSLVYRGAVPDTSVTKDLADDVSGPRITAIDSLDSLDPDQTYLVVPRYDGLALTARECNGALSLARVDGSPVTVPSLDAGQLAGFHPTEPVLCILVGYRGRERCPLEQLERYLADGSGPVGRLVLNLYPDQGLPTLSRVRTRSRFDIGLLPYRLATLNEVTDRAREIMTRDGVEIWPLAGGGTQFQPAIGYTYRPPDQFAPTVPKYMLSIDPANSSANLVLSGMKAGDQTLELPGFDLARLRQGRRFIAHKLAGKSKTPGGKGGLRFEGRLKSTDLFDGGLAFGAGGELSGEFALRPARLNGRNCLLFYQAADTGEPGGDK